MTLIRTQTFDPDSTADSTTALPALGTGLTGDGCYRWNLLVCQIWLDFLCVNFYFSKLAIALLQKNNIHLCIQSLYYASESRYTRGTLYVIGCCTTSARTVRTPHTHRTNHLARSTTLQWLRAQVPSRAVRSACRLCETEPLLPQLPRFGLLLWKARLAVIII